LIETFKIVTGRGKVKMNYFFECKFLTLASSNYNLCGHQFNISVQRNRTDARSSFLVNVL